MTDEMEKPMDAPNGEPADVKPQEEADSAASAQPPLPQQDEPAAAVEETESSEPAAEEAAAEAPSESAPESSETPEPAPAEPVTEAPAAPESAPAEPVAEAPAAPEPAPAEPAAAAQPAPEAKPERPPSRFNRGDLVPGVLASKSPLMITFDLGEGTTGEIMSRELERMSPQQLQELEEGKSYTVFIVNPMNHEGKTLVSLSRAEEEIDWRQAEEYRGEQKVFDGTVAGFNKGGLIVRFGRLRGFVPLSQMSDERRRAVQASTPDQYDSMVNQSINCKVMEVDQKQNRLILSERMANRESREKRKEELISKLNVGQLMNGRVVSLEDFGAFVDIGGAEGLVHLTELSWKHVTHPRDVLKVGQEVRVEVISVDRERKRIGLSIKRTEADPWDEIATAYTQGQLVRARVTKLTKFGAFARLVDNNEIEGLIHISELSDSRVNHPKDVVNEGDEVTLRVIKVDVRNRRLGLSLKRVNSAEYLDLDLGRDWGDEH
ncbi:MAG: S1 RNA-binding domain-containing protein [Chloroflexi bacterium]|nr:S1 RNA-binding domain-containing protein [Chloroflexota bacterium]